jgi:uncharacterized protein (TIGR03437 family)
VKNQLPKQLDGVSVTVNGKAAYVSWISPGQLNVLTPPDAMRGGVPVQVAVDGVLSGVFTVQAQPLTPAFFVFNGGPNVVATHADQSLLGPATLYPGASTPAAPGETVVLYGNGFGPASDPVVSGAVSQSGTLSPLPVIRVGGRTATVQFAGVTGPGLYQFNVTIPTDLPAGDQPLTAAFNGFNTQPGVVLAVKQ